MSEQTISLDEKRRFHRDGFLILRNIVSGEQVRAARRLLFERMGALPGAAAKSSKAGSTDAMAQAVANLGEAGTDDRIVDLFNKSPLLPIMASLLGSVQPASRAQVATVYPNDDDDDVNEAGYRNADTPNYGWCGHLDGLWNGAIATPPISRKLSATQEQQWHASPSTNGAERYYPDLNSNIACFSALVGVALSDQREAGSGNLGLLKGAHRHMEKFFRWQRDQGGPLGPEGPGWPRVDADAPNGHGLVHYPDRVRHRYRRSAAITPDGRVWPKPTLVKVKPGDAVIVHWATPHSRTRLFGSDPRMMAYFRTTRYPRPEAFKRSYPDAMCNNWLEWPGMREVL